MNKTAKNIALRGNFYFPETILTVMRTLLFFIVMGLGSVYGNSSFSQTKMNIEVEKVPLEQLFKEIQQKSEYVFFYKDGILDNKKEVTVKFSNAKIQTILDEAFKGKRLGYKLKDRQVVIFELKVSKKDSQTFLQNPQFRVEGTVTDPAGMPIPGVNVIEKGTSNGVVTDFDGEFSIEVTPDAILEISYLGYATTEIEVDGQTELNISLSPEASALDEVVVVGYGTQKKINVTGAISQIDSEEINTRAANSAGQILQGLAPNLNIDASANAGMSDASVNINIRGMGSLSSSAPYILINGVRATEAEFSALNPASIESVSVLKDAAASAIYGAQAAFGVILVETKDGSKNQEFSISFSSNLRTERPIFVPEPVNSLTFARVANDASMNYSGQVLFNDEQIDKIRAFMDGELEYGTAPDPNNPNQWLGIGGGSSAGWLSGYANTDWYDVMYKDIGFSQKHDLSVTGGGDNFTYYLSGGLLRDEGQFKYGDENENFSRYNLNSNVSADVTDWFTVSNIIRYYQVDNIFPATLEGASRGRLFHDIMRWPTLVPLRTPAIEDEQGNIIVPEQLTTLAAFNKYNGFNTYQTNNLVSSFKAKIEITEGLTLNGDYTFKKNFRERTLNYKKWEFIGPDGDPSIIYQANNNQITKDWSRDNYTSINIYADYSKTFMDNHNLTVIAGYQQEENKYERLQVGRQEVVANNLNSIDVAVGEIIGPFNPISSWATLGVFGRMTYNYKEKYLFEFNGRYDGSSKFAENNRFGFFPSLALGYNIHKEEFWNPIANVINTMKIRASWGRLGNQDVAGNLYLSSIPINTQLPWIIGGERPIYTGMPDITSSNITWESSETLNLGLDFGFLSNRLTASIDVYERETDHIFGPLSALPAVLGTNPPETNSASLRTKGWEFVAGWRDDISDFGYNLTFMLSDNVTTITKYNNPNKILSNWYVGEVIGEIWGFEADNLFQSQEEVEEYTSQVDLSYFGTGWQAGNVKYKDLNGDGIVNVGKNTLAEPGDRKVIGNNHPRYRFSVQAGASWKNFDFYMLWQGIGKRDIFPDSYQSVFWGWNSFPHTRVTEPSLDYWSETNSDAYLPIPLVSGGRSGFGKDRHPSTRYLQNGAYVRLKSMNVGYTLPSSLIEKWKFDNVRVYLTGENLLTFTKMWPGIDPEVGVIPPGGGRIGIGRAYPLSQVLSFGIDITL